MSKEFAVSFMLKIDKNNNILSSSEADHAEDVTDLIHDLFYDVDDVKVTNVKTEERDT
jgi:hypothetical protein